jgi:hypothetical protein
MFRAMKMVYVTTMENLKTEVHAEHYPIDFIGNRQFGLKVPVKSG